MSKSRLHLLAQKIIAIENVNLTPVPTEFPPSAFNANALYKAEAVAVRTETPNSAGEPSALFIAWTQPILNPITSTPIKNLKTAIEGETLLVTKKVSSDFNQIYLYRGSDGSLLSQFTPHSDFFIFITSPDIYKTYRLSQVKAFVAQVLLAVKAYHSQKLAHRDIKPENFLVFDIAGNKILKLTDHDDTIEVINNGQPVKKLVTVVGSLGHRSPELVHASITELSHLDYKAVDCYAVAQTLKKLCLGLLLPFELELLNPYYQQENYAENEYCYLAKMIDGLMRALPNNRLTIKEALESPYFGDNAVSRNEYLKSVTGSAKSALLLDATRITASIKNLDDASYLMPREVSQIYYSGKYLADSIKKINLAFVDFAGATDAAVRFKEIQASAKKHVALAHSFNYEKATTNLLKSFRNYEIELESVIGELKQQLYSKLSHAIRLAVEKSVIMYRENMLTAQNKGLGEAGRFTLFQRLNFSFADTLLAKITVETPYQESFKIIYQFIGEEKGFSKDAFKAVLMENLLQVLHEKLDKFRKEAEGLAHTGKRRRLG